MIRLHVAALLMSAGADHVGAHDRTLRNLSIRFENERDCFFEVLANFFERRALSIRPRKFFDETNVPLRRLHEDSSEIWLRHICILSAEGDNDEAWI